jgi:hypothetical protein
MFDNPPKEEDHQRMKKSFISRLTKPYRLRRVREKILSYFFFKQWILLIAKGVQNESASWNNFTPLMPPSDRLWADPFVWKHEGNYYIFCEERLYSSNRGHIACLTLDNQMNPIANSVVLERPYHLSYPFIFEYQEQIYMIPETEKNRTVELYRCTCFPNHWVFVKTLLTNIKAVDATLLETNGKWWLFTNIREGGTNWDALHLFYADDPLSNQWIPHPRNPIVKDIRSARPAGRIFSYNGEFIRPSQDCSVRYGYAINFSRIAVLTDSDYEEICEWSLKPPARRNIYGTHTWNEAGGLTTIDALIRRTKY